MRIFLALVGLLVATPPVAQADVPIGLWQTEPDRTGNVFHVRTRACGPDLCGQIERVKNRFGYDTPSRDVGRNLLSGMRELGEGRFEGQVWEPDTNRMLSARMHVQGNTIRMTRCASQDCSSTSWHRLR